jgi:hypothetical protein
MLEDAGSDMNKKSAVVNQVAETISKINKAEDFTKQQGYIKQSAELLKIEESGLHALVNKFIRERINKEEQRSGREDLNNKLQALSPFNQKFMRLKMMQPHYSTKMSSTKRQWCGACLNLV